MRYEIRTLPIGQKIDETKEYITVVEVMNIRPENNTFRALVLVDPALIFDPAPNTGLVAQDAVLTEEE